MLGSATALIFLAFTAPPDVHARAALVVDLDSGEVVFEKGDKNKARAIASLTKLMAVRVIHQHNLDLDGTTEMIKSDYTLTSGGARSRLKTGGTYRNKDLLHAALLGSDNRAILAMGRSVGLTPPALIAAMNTEARRMGLHDMSYIDATGINHLNRARPVEVAALLVATLQTTLLAEIARKATWDADANERSGRPLQYRNTNLLVHDEGLNVLAGKTGFNSAAGWCVATAVQLRSGRRLAVVVMGSPEKYLRFRDARRLITWAAKQPWNPPAPN